MSDKQSLPVLDITPYEKLGAELNKGFDTFKVGAERLTLRPLQSEEEYQRCLELANDAGRQGDAIVKSFDEPAGLMNRLHKSITGLRSKLSQPWYDHQKRLKDHARQWYLEQHAQKEQIQAQMDKQITREKSDIEKEADRLMCRGQVRDAEALLATRDQVTVPILPPAAPKVEGVKVTDKWVGTCDDILAVAKAIVEGKVPLMHFVKGEEKPLICVDQKVLNALVDRQGKSLSIPGVSVKADVRFGRKG